MKPTWTEISRIDLDWKDEEEDEDEIIEKRRQARLEFEKVQ